MTSKFVMGFCILMILMCLISAILAKPMVINIPRRQECGTSEATEVLCQTCAKLTKSALAYPMCCENREDARRWCSDYIDFGLQIPNPKLHS